MTDATEAGATLRDDMTYVLLECRRDVNVQVFFRDGTDDKALGQLASLLARKLGPLIGGRYVPKRDERAVRDAAVCKAFTGRNHADVMRAFGISRRLLYSILARQRKAT